MFWIFTLRLRTVPLFPPLIVQRARKRRVRVERGDRARYTINGGIREMPAF